MFKDRKVLFISLLLLLSVLTACAKHEQPAVKKVNLPPTEPEPVVVEVAAVGDFLMHMPVINAAWQNEINNYNFAAQLTPVENLLANPDLTIANLETRLAGKENGGYSGYPAFNCPEQLAFDMKKVGIDIVTTANNHSLDRGFNGLVQTLDWLDTAGLTSIGNYRTVEEKKPPLVLDIKGIKIGLLNYTESINGITIPPEKEFAINMLNLDSIAQDVNKLHSFGAEVIIMYLHFGVEYQRYPNEQQKQLVNDLFALGIDIIFGDHVHVIQPMEMQTISIDGKQKNVFVIYSLGNFISNQRWRYADSGVIVNVSLEKDFIQNKVDIKKVDYIPTWVHIFELDGRKQYQVLPVEKAIKDYENQLDPTITEADYQRLKEVWQETTTHLTKEQQGIFPRLLQ